MASHGKRPEVAGVDVGTAGLDPGASAARTAAHVAQSQPTVGFPFGGELAAGKAKLKKVKQAGQTNADAAPSAPEPAASKRNDGHGYALDLGKEGAPAAAAAPDAARAAAIATSAAAAPAASVQATAVAAAAAPAAAAPVPQPPKLELRVGDVVNSRTIPAVEYKVVQELGNGAFGKAFLVQTETADAEGKRATYTYALKLIDTDSAEARGAFAKHDDAGRKHCMELEALFLQRLRHPNIVGYCEHFFWEEQRRNLLIIMEFCGGGDLRSRINSMKEERRRKADGEGYFTEEAQPVVPGGDGEGYFTEEVIMDWGVQIIMALEFLRGEHIIHRDLKPDNVFLSASGAVRLADFGIAKDVGQTGALAKTGQGTQAYKAPEVHAGKEYDSRVDLWSLGVILYELAVHDTNYSELVEQSKSNRKTHSLPDNIAKHYTDKFGKLVEALLTRDPSNRPHLRDLFDRSNDVSRYVHTQLQRYERKLRTAQSETAAFEIKAAQLEPVADRDCYSEDRDEGRLYHARFAGEQVDVWEPPAPIGVKATAEAVDVMRGLATLRHRRLVQVKAFCLAPIQIVMAPSSSTSLRDLLSNNDACHHLDLPSRVWLMRDVCDALVFLHARGTPHGSLSCKSVVAITKHAQGNGGTGPQYMAQLRGPGICAALRGELEACSAEDDVLAFGVLCYELLGLIAPAGAAKPTRFACPIELREIIGKCMVEDPRERPSASAILATFEQVLTVFSIGLFRVEGGRDKIATLAFRLAREGGLSPGLRAAFLERVRALSPEGGAERRVLEMLPGAVELLAVAIERRDSADDANRPAWTRGAVRAIAARALYPQPVSDEDLSALLATALPNIADPRAHPLFDIEDLRKFCFWLYPAAESFREAGQLFARPNPMQMGSVFLTYMAAKRELERDAVMPRAFLLRPSQQSWPFWPIDVDDIPAHEGFLTATFKSESGRIENQRLTARTAAGVEEEIRGLHLVSLKRQAKSTGSGSDRIYIRR